MIANKEKTPVALTTEVSKVTHPNELRKDTFMPIIANNLISVDSKELTMSSREIADLVESRHDKVKQSIERLAARGVIQLPPMGEVKNHLGQTVQEYRLIKRDTYVVVAQLSPEFTARLVDRWQELEEGQRFDPVKALNDPATMRGLLLNYSEKVLDLEHKVSEMTPKVDALKRIYVADGSLCITDAAKTLQVRRKDLINYLHSNGWIYKRAGGDGNWLAYSDKEKSGVLEHKTAIIIIPDGTERIQSQARITPKGLAKLAEIFNTVKEAQAEEVAA